MTSLECKNIQHVRKCYNLFFCIAIFWSHQCIWRSIFWTFSLQSRVFFTVSPIIGTPYLRMCKYFLCSFLNFSPEQIFWSDYAIKGGGIFKEIKIYKKNISPSSFWVKTFQRQNHKQYSFLPILVSDPLILSSIGEKKVLSYLFFK